MNRRGSIQLCCKHVSVGHGEFASSTQGRESSESAMIMEGVFILMTARSVIGGSNGGNQLLLSQDLIMSLQIFTANSCKIQIRPKYSDAKNRHHKSHSVLPIAGSRKRSRNLEVSVFQIASRLFHRSLSFVSSDAASNGQPPGNSSEGPSRRSLGATHSLARQVFLAISQTSSAPLWVCGTKATTFLTSIFIAGLKVNGEQKLG
ncbi:hypothetical protein B0T21DRAFT_348177 [Apiosordaria backusii]|uniref:Uncharacterized protein n=1 Tax=Apiosordaria backusii TaxID=314023 RepID=A0AA40BKX5_9PEZI|nr:hypothetical protein B0T21DRAFT_348177 [Apiosordaria backusii]